MEHARLILGNDPAFDLLVHGVPDDRPLPDAGDLTIATKDTATVGGKPAAVLSFSVQLPDGSVRRVQTVTTVSILATVLAGLRGRYGHGGPEAHRFGDDNPFL